MPSSHLFDGAIMTGTAVLAKRMAVPAGKSRGGFVQLSWTGTPQGTFKVFARTGNLPREDVTGMLAPAPGPAAGVAGSALMFFPNGFPGEEIEVEYTNTAGSGLLSGIGVFGGDD